MIAHKYLQVFLLFFFLLGGNSLFAKANKTTTTDLLETNKSTYSPPVNTIILGYDLDCTHPHALDPMYSHAESYTPDESLPFMMMDNGVGLQGNVFVPINFPQGARGEEIQDLQINIDLTHNDFTDLEIILHAPTAMNLSPITLATFGEVTTSNTFSASSGLNTTLNGLIGALTIPTESTVPQAIIEETVGNNLISSIGDTWYIQVLDTRSSFPNAAYGGGIITSASIVMTSGFPPPELDPSCTVPAQSIVFVSQSLIDTNCNQSSGNGAYIERVWEVTDVNGLVFNVTQTINLKFPTLAEVDLPTDIYLDYTPQINTLPDTTGMPSIGGFELTSSSVDDCDITYTYTDQTLSNCGIGYEIIREWLIIQWCTGTSITHQQVISVIDTQAPIIPSTLDLGTNSTNCTGDISQNDLNIIEYSSFTSLTATYNNGGGIYNPNQATTTVSLSNNQVITGMPLGTSEILIDATDGCLNTSQQLVTVTIVDNTPPSVVCNNQLSPVLGANGTATILAIDLDDNSTDNCSNSLTIDTRRINGCLGVSSWGSSVDFDCCDIGQVVTVELRATDAVGNSAICTEYFSIDDNVAPVITCPLNLTYDCDDPNVASPFGTPTIDDNCGSASIINEVDGGELDQCQAGAISRTWTVSDGSNQSADVSCTQWVTVNHVSDFIVQFPADITVNDCATSNTGTPTITDDDCELLAINNDDLILDIVSNACYKIERTWTVINWCIYDQGDPANTDLGLPQPLPRTYQDDDGYFQYTQVIHVNDDISPTITCSSDLVICDDTDLCESMVTFTVTATDNCINFYPLEYTHKIDVFNDGAFDIVAAGNDASWLLPYGIHLIKWIVEDECGNTNECTHLFTIEDCRNPEPICVNNFAPPAITACTSFSATSFLVSATDNCSSDTFVEGSVRVRLAGSTLAPTTTIDFCLSDAGTHDVEVWVEDEAGNADFCTTTITITANNLCLSDTENPIPVCQNNASVLVHFGTCETVPATDVLNLAIDNCSDSTYLFTNATIRKNGDTNPPQASIDFCESDEGMNLVEVWVTDEAGNSDYCLALIEVVYTPCETNIVLNNMTVPNNGYFADEAVISNGIIGPYGNAVFTAGDSIVLEAGFEVVLGSVFHAFIQNCPNALTEEEIEEE